MRANVVELAAAATPADFKRKVFGFLGALAGDLSVYRPLGARVLVATYIPPEKTRGGIIRPTTNVGEARFTGNVGLILALGPVAFKYDGQFPWEGDKPQVGDWVHYQFSAGREFFLGPPGDVAVSDHGISCRVLHSDSVDGLVSDPNRFGTGNGFENLGG